MAGDGEGPSSAEQDTEPRPKSRPGSGTKVPSGRRVAAMVLALTNLAFVLMGAEPITEVPLPGAAERTVLEVLVAAFPLVGTAAMTLLIPQGRVGRG